MNGRFRSFFPALVKGALCALAVVLVYRAALACGWISEMTDTFATPASVVARHIALELTCAFVFSAAMFALGARYALIYGVFLGMELAIAYLCRSPVGVYEFVSIVSFPALYAGVAFLMPRGSSALSRAFRWGLALLVLFAALQSSCYIAYILRYSGRPSPSAVMAALKTNGGEARDFLLDQFGLPYALLAVSLGLGVWIASVALSLSEKSKRWAPAALFCLLAAAISLGYRSKGDCWSSLVFDLRSGLMEFRRAVDAMNRLRGSRNSDLAALHVKRSGGGGELCVVVIGESANREHMNCWGYERPNTPWMSSAPLILLKNAYSCMTHTDFALTMALSRANDYTLTGAPESGEALAQVMDTLSLPEVLREAGVKTYWITNHKRAGVYNRFVTVQLAMNADVRFFTRDEATTSGLGDIHFDGEMLPRLREVLDGASEDENLVIFFHVFGSHWVYATDAPRDWPWLPPSPLLDRLSSDARERVEAYDRSISYTDWVLEQVVDTIQKSKFSVSSMVYFADHSEDVLSGDGHNFDALNPSMTTIPAAFWCSEGYERRWPRTVAQLRANKNRVFTNDLAFELICGVTHVTFDGLDERYQLTSPNYAVTPETARFWQGRILKEVVPDLRDR